jgi:hypothetical protein
VLVKTLKKIVSRNIKLIGLICVLVLSVVFYWSVRPYKLKPGQFFTVELEGEKIEFVVLRRFDADDRVMARKAAIFCSLIDPNNKLLKRPLQFDKMYWVTDLNSINALTVKKLTQSWMFFDVDIRPIVDKNPYQMLDFGTSLNHEMCHLIDDIKDPFVEKLIDNPIYKNANKDKNIEKFKEMFENCCVGKGNAIQ